ncbi:MAG TPA: TraR/DksA C4-type zinc finger protein [Candidatus Binatia bacterium]
MLQHLASESRSASRAAVPNGGNCGEAFLTDRLAAVYERELGDIETALDRIRTGTFGYCRACHQSIEPSRLERFPRAEFCQRCKEQ